MPFDFFLAQTGAEIHRPLPPEAGRAWMACHFSSSDQGLSNLPQALPEGSMVMVDDFIPAAAHDPQKIAAQLAQVVERCHCHRVLLDFQRPGDARTADIAAAIVAALRCPVGVSEAYAKGLPCPVCLPPLPLHMPLADYIAPWKGRQVWLEVMPQAAVYTVTGEGCKQAECDAQGPFPHFNEQAFCRYRMEVAEDAIRFTLSRGLEELEKLRQSKLVDCFVGLYQDFV